MAIAKLPPQARAGIPFLRDWQHPRSSADFRDCRHVAPGILRVARSDKADHRTGDVLFSLVRLIRHPRICRKDRYSILRSTSHRYPAAVVRDNSDFMRYALSSRESSIKPRNTQLASAQLTVPLVVDLRAHPHTLRTPRRTGADRRCHRGAVLPARCRVSQRWSGRGRTSSACVLHAPAAAVSGTTLGVPSDGARLSSSTADMVVTSLAKRSLKVRTDMCPDPMRSQQVMPILRMSAVVRWPER